MEHIKTALENGAGSTISSHDITFPAWCSNLNTAEEPRNRGHGHHVPAGWVGECSQGGLVARFFAFTIVSCTFPSSRDDQFKVKGLFPYFPSLSCFLFSRYDRAECAKKTVALRLSTRLLRFIRGVFCCFSCSSRDDTGREGGGCLS